MAGLEPDVVTYEAMSNASAQRAACREHSIVQCTLMAGLKPGVATCEAISNASAQEGDLQEPQKFVSGQRWLACSLTWPLARPRAMRAPRGRLAGGHRSFQWTIVPGLGPGVVTYQAISNASAQRATCKGPLESFGRH